MPERLGRAAVGGERRHRSPHSDAPGKRRGGRGHERRPEHPRRRLRRAARVDGSQGRERVERWSPRTIDIDILLLGSHIEQTPRLTLPHPGIAQRAFVVLPLVELSPELVLPNGERLADIALSKTIQGQVIRRVEGVRLLLEE